MPVLYPIWIGTCDGTQCGGGTMSAFGGRRGNVLDLGLCSKE